MEDTINIRDLLTRNGWKIEEAKEYKELRNQLKETTADLEEVVTEWDVEYKRREQLEKKCTFFQRKIKNQDEQHQNMLQKYTQMQHEADEWKKKYEELLQKKLDERADAQRPPKKAVELCFVQQNTEQTLSLVEQKQLVKPTSSHDQQQMKQDESSNQQQQQEPLKEEIKVLPRNKRLLTKRAGMKNELTLPATQQPAPPSTKPPVSRKPARILRFKSLVNTSVPVEDGNVMSLLPSPPKGTAPTLVYRRRHRSFIHSSDSSEQYLQQCVAVNRPPTPIGASSECAATSAKCIYRQQ